MTAMTSMLLVACQSPSAVKTVSVKVMLPDGKVRVIESTTPTFLATVMKVAVQHKNQSFNIDSTVPTVSSQGLVTGGLFTPTAPEGAHWQLLMLGGTKVESISKRQPYLRMSGGQMQGLTGCNVMTGAYNRQNEKMQFIQVKGTNTVCPDVQKMERTLIISLQQLRSWRLTDKDHHLQFLSEKGEVLAEFIALSP
ncbi:MAG: META domain-containing protein [Moraxellaceae bacterium]|jgi:heat shock protein HslJ|nr:META domain-containing protein [Moraxellaceae bacterium]